MPDKIEIEALRLVVNAIFDHIADLKISHVDLDQNFYWEVPREDLFVTNVKPEMECLGSLHDDLEFLAPVIEDKDQAVSLLLVHVAPLLRFVGEKIGQ